MKKIRNIMKRSTMTLLACAAVMTAPFARLETVMAEDTYDILDDGEPEALTSGILYETGETINIVQSGIQENTAENVGESTHNIVDIQESLEENGSDDTQGSLQKDIWDNAQDSLQENTLNHSESNAQGPSQEGILEIPQNTTQTDMEETKEIADAVPVDFSLSMTADTEILKAGEIAVYEIRLVNTGETAFTDLKLSSSFSCPKVTQEWQPAVNLTAEGAQAQLSLLEPGQEVFLYLAAQLIPEQTNPLTHHVEVSAYNPENPEEKITKEAEMVSEIEPLKVDFSVTKTADRQVAFPGDTITYQICIRNTGERTLHSVVGTERFLNSGLQAKFLEQEGVVLNESKDKAMIAQLLPGDSVTLAAQVTLPEDEVSQELINQITVITAETGEQTVTSQAIVRLEQPEMTATHTEAAAEYIYNSAEEIPVQNSGFQNPKTGDFYGVELFAALLAVSVAYMLMSLVLFIGKKKHPRLGKGERNH